jgi:hypothetical protein
MLYFKARQRPDERGEYLDELIPLRRQAHGEIIRPPIPFGAIYRQRTREKNGDQEKK